MAEDREPPIVPRVIFPGSPMPSARAAGQPIRPPIAGDRDRALAADPYDEIAVKVALHDVESAGHFHDARIRLGCG
jgi:hypothetical protein